MHSGGRGQTVAKQTFSSQPQPAVMETAYA
jgi:hypothetical protein